MKSIPWTKLLILLFSIILWINYFSGISAVPFHPDESTQIYMSADVKKFVQDPASLAFPGAKFQDDQLRYRLIDSPLTRTFIGTGLQLRGQAPIQVDWNWSKTWQENDKDGALPPLDVLTTARYSVAWMFPFSCLFIFLTTKKLGGWLAGVIAIILFATNALILIHTRRAMAESALICFLCGSIWFLICVDKRIWLAAIPIGLAINAKQTLFPLMGFGLLNIFTKPFTSHSKSNRLIHAAVFTTIILIISWVLNPVYWKSPASALKAGMDFRTELTTLMSLEHQSSFSALERTAILIGQVFIEPLAVGDVSNYLTDTREQSDLYFQNPVNNLFRGLNGGAVFLGLTIFGYLVLIRRLFSMQEQLKYQIYTYLILTLGMLMTIMLFTPFNFQRYYIVIVPFFIVSQAIGLSLIFQSLFQRIKKGLPN